MVVTCSMAAEMMLLVLAAFSSLLATSAAWMRSVNEKGNVMFDGDRDGVNDVGVLVVLMVGVLVVLVVGNKTTFHCW
jgi:hypothetical protein